MYSSVENLKKHINEMEDTKEKNKNLDEEIQALKYHAEHNGETLIIRIVGKHNKSWAALITTMKGKIDPMTMDDKYYVNSVIRYIQNSKVIGFEGKSLNIECYLDEPHKCCFKYTAYQFEEIIYKVYELESLVDKITSRLDALEKIINVDDNINANI